METNEDELLFKDKQVSEDVKRKVLASKRAHEIVKQLLDEKITEKFFVESVYFLTVEHYEDVAEERAILNLCGYPVCGNKLKNIPSQQFRISGNKVYDITQRKNFCSGRCYKSYEHVKKQILPTPLWLRDPNSVVPVSLDQSGRSLKGEEVNLIPILSNQEADGSEDEELHDGIMTRTKDDEPSLTKNSNSPIKDSDSSAKIQHITPTRQVISPREKIKGNQPSVTCQSTNEQYKRILEKLIGVLKEWLTVESLKVLDYVTTPQEEPEAKQPDQAEVRKANKLKLLEERLNKVVLGDKHTAAPKSSRDLEKEAMYVYTQRVEQFYKGRMEFKDKVRFKRQDVDPAEEEPVQQITYPHVDSKDQVVIRRKILHQKLAKVIQDLLPSLHPSVSSKDLRRLISTFNLTSSNVVMRTNEYPIMGIILLQLMSHNSNDVTTALIQSQSLINRIVSSYNTSTAKLKQDINSVIHHLIANADGPR